MSQAAEFMCRYTARVRTARYRSRYRSVRVGVAGWVAALLCALIIIWGVAAAVGKLWNRAPVRPARRRGACGPGGSY